MASQTFEYTTHATQIRGNKIDNIAAVINEHASEGWELAETLEHEGTTVGLVFRREC